MTLRFLALAGVLACLLFGQATHASTASPDSTAKTRHIICKVFGPYCSQAISVASCETGGTFSIWSRNGQYLGIFQMGSSERAHYVRGYFWSAWEQSRSAHRYFVASGRDWSPWSCRP